MEVDCPAGERRIQPKSPEPVKGSRRSEIAQIVTLRQTTDRTDDTDGSIDEKRRPQN
jgi:hypothetical protein